MSFTGSLALMIALAGSGAGPAQEPAPPPATSAPMADAPGVYRIGSGVTAPKVLFAPEPAFSELARKKKIAGACTVSLVVDTAGNPTEVQIVRSIADTQPKKLKAAALSLDDEALNAVRQYRFSPALLNGRPVSVTMTVDIKFQIF